MVRYIILLVVIYGLFRYWSYKNTSHRITEERRKRLSEEDEYVDYEEIEDDDD